MGIQIYIPKTEEVLLKDLLQQIPNSKLAKSMNDIKELVYAYEEAQEKDYCQRGTYEGLRYDEIVLRLIEKLKKILGEK